MNVEIAPRTGLTLGSPVITASGTFGYGIEFAKRMDISGLGAVICKGTTREARAGNPPPRIIETAAGMLNSIGLLNLGVDEVVRELAPQWLELPVPVLVNVSGTSIEDYIHVVEKLDGVAGVAGIELNISCPNVREGGTMFGASSEMSRAVTEAARESTSLPLIVKLSPNVTDIRSIGAAVEEAGADAISVANTVFGLAIDAKRRRPALANVTGGLSGPAIKPYIQYLVYEVAQEVSIPIIGVGGILTGEDAIEYLMAGATAVAIGTALLVDPTAWRRIAAEMEDWLRRERVGDINEVIGVANKGFKKKTGKTSLAGG